MSQLPASEMIEHFYVGGFEAWAKHIKVASLHSGKRRHRWERALLFQEGFGRLNSAREKAAEATVG